MLKGMLGDELRFTVFTAVLSTDTRQFVFNPFICIEVTVKEFHDHTIRLRIAAKCIGFVCVYVHGEVIASVYPYNDICVDQGTAVAFGEDEYFVIVFDMQGKCIFRRHMDVAFGYDDAFGNFNITAGTAENTARCVFDISGLADYAGDTEFSDICQGKFYLSFLTEGTEKCHVLEDSFRTFDSDSFLTEILTGLA